MSRTYVLLYDFRITLSDGSMSDLELTDADAAGWFQRHEPAGPETVTFRLADRTVARGYTCSSAIRWRDGLALLRGFSAMRCSTVPKAVPHELQC